MIPELVNQRDHDDREYPRRPIVGVAGAVVANRRVLLIQRGREPMLGAWTLPGGALETGETILQGVVREVLEETGLRVRPLELLATLDRIVRDEQGRVQFHYVLLDWLCVPEEMGASGAEHAVVGSDALALSWLSAEELETREELDDATRGVLRDALARAEARDE